MAAFFYKWEASLFVLMASIFMEMILLFIGSIIIGNKITYKHDDIGKAGAAYALLASSALVYPMAFVMADLYGEFSKPNLYGYFQPIVDYKWQILVMAFSLGIGYLVDFKSLKGSDLGKFISEEVYRVCFLLFGIGILGMMCIVGIKEMANYYGTFLSEIEPDNPYNPSSKMIPIMLMIAARMGIEIWYLKRMKTRHIV